MEHDQTVLEYAKDSPQPPISRRSQWLFFVLLSPAIVLPFLPYVFFVMPVLYAWMLVSYAWEEFTLHEWEWDAGMLAGALGVAVMWGIVVIGWKALALLPVRMRRWEIWLGYALSVLGAVPLLCVLAFMWFELFGDLPDAQHKIDWCSMALPLLPTATLVFGAVILWRLRQVLTPAMRVNLCLLVPYAALLLGLTAWSYAPLVVWPDHFPPEELNWGFYLGVLLLIAASFEIRRHAYLAFRRSDKFSAAVSQNAR